MGKRAPAVSLYVDADLKSAIAEEAERRFEGNESMLWREAVRLYLDLRQRLGTNFDAAIEDLRERTAERV